MLPTRLFRDAASLCVVLVFLLNPVVLGRSRNERDEKKELMEKMVAAVELAMSFFSQDYSNINLDGLFGMRIGEGQIVEALEECKSSSSCPEALQRRLQALSNDIHTAADAAMDYVKEEDAEYYEQFIPTINKPYLLRYLPRRLKDLDSFPVGNNDEYGEERGDACLSRMMGTYEEYGKPIEECNVTRDCWDYMTEAGRSEYAITHQLLYFVMAEKQGCVERVESRMGVNVTQVEETMCGSIYKETAAEVHRGHVEESYQDLFMEQVVLCGSLGFEDFLKSDWMHMVLKWQAASGCFSMQDSTLLAYEAFLLQKEKEQRRLWKELKLEADMIEQQHQGRKLLREQLMSDGCLAHKSGLGFATLCLFSRSLVRQNFLYL